MSTTLLLSSAILETKDLLESDACLACKKPIREEAARLFQITTGFLDYNPEFSVCPPTTRIIRRHFLETPCGLSQAKA